MKKNQDKTKSQKSSGRFSVFDELVGNVESEQAIVFKLDPQFEQDIVKKTHEADLPTAKKTRDKVGTQPGTELETNQRQTRDKPGTNQRQRNPSILKTRDKVGTQPGTELETNQRQTRDKPSTIDDICNVNALSGIQLKIMQRFFSICIKNGSTKIENISIEFISQNLSSPINTVKKSIQRLEKKGLVSRVSYKNGRGGFSTYQLNHNAYNQLLKTESRDKLGTNWGQTEYKVGTQPGTQPGTTSPSSSSILNNNTTTTETINRLFDIPQNILGIGFHQKHIQQVLAKTELTVEEIETSISHFSHDLQKNAVKARTSPLNLLLGVMLKQRSVYISEGYLDAQKGELEQYLKRKKEMDGILKQIQEAKKQQVFESWNASITDQERESFVKTNKFLKTGTSQYTAVLKDYWAKNIYQDKSI